MRTYNMRQARNSTAFLICLVYLQLILGLTAFLSGCDSELEAEEQASVPTNTPKASEVAMRDQQYWEQIVFGEAPGTVEGTIRSDPFEPIVIKKSPAPSVSERPQRPQRPRDEMILTGIIKGQLPLAILRINGEEKLVQVGDRVGTHEVLQISTEGVVVRTDGAKRTLRLQGTEWTP